MTTSPLENLKKTTAAKVAKAAEAKAPVQEAVSAEPEVAETVEETFQYYKSSISTQRIAMQNGKIIHITDGKYITKDPDEIEFLDYEISKGFPYLQKGEPVTTSDLDPMSALRKKFFAEFMAQQAGQKAPVPNPTLGNSEAQPLTPANTAALKALAGESSSPAG